MMKALDLTHCNQRPGLKLCAMLLFTAFVSGCDTAPSSPTASSDPPTAAEWVSSEDAVLAFRLAIDRPKVARNADIQVVAQLRNAGQVPVTVLRPFGDWYYAQGIGVKIWSSQNRVRYIGPMASYVVGAKAFAILGPGEMVEQKLELNTGNFADFDRPGTYALRYDYAYDGYWDTTAAVGNSGISNAWRGTISSREIQIQRE